jgi:hypothetical protein
MPVLEAANDMTCNAVIPIQERRTDETNELLQHMAALLDEAKPDPQKRCSQRFPINFALRLMPKCEKGKLLLFTPMTIVGKNLSPTGIGFLHKAAIPHKRVIIYFYHPNIQRFAVEAEIVWTRARSADEFESGCRLVRKLALDELVTMF